jgi:hypothetical protein
VVIGRGHFIAELSMADLASRHTSLEDVFLELTNDTLEYQGGVPRRSPASDARRIS